MCRRGSQTARQWRRYVCTRQRSAAAVDENPLPGKTIFKGQGRGTTRQRLFGMRWWPCINQEHCLSCGYALITPIQCLPQRAGAHATGFNQRLDAACFDMPGTLPCTQAAIGVAEPQQRRNIAAKGFGYKCGNSLFAGQIALAQH